MTQLEQQMKDEPIVAQGLTNDLANNLTTKGVPSNTNEGLDTLVPKVLTISGGTVEHDDTLNKNSNTDFLHTTQVQQERWTNNYSYKIENTIVSTWAVS